ncbi:protein kinase domain-containing protein [Nannocystis punicea]|uniref:Protein kinase n=1 Tax=Nannocystis punicea TaxID=2995304 RepID=A0ABY7H9P6_9BACT|nr:protein kinase [Nannocystis poenicansa]WAS95998.1 protein kinase [Nannocystis poenicansa]
MSVSETQARSARATAITVEQSGAGVSSPPPSSTPAETLEATHDDLARHTRLDRVRTAEADAPEDRLGRYRLLRVLGEGGMGVVYVAYDELLDRRVAIKRVRTDSRGSNAHGRILHEAKALAQLSHPNVVQLFEVSASAGRIFIAMEYVAGSTLRAWTARWRAGGGSQRELLDMYVQSGRGLAAAHAQGLVHRDFKPENVLVGDDGRARVVDFGLVTWGDLDDEPTPDDTTDLRGTQVRLTAAGVILGTPAYMSPEQFADRLADPRSDQFSFCAALYEALCDARPFAGDSFAELHQAVLAGALREPGERVPPWLWAVLRRGLSRRPEDRFPTMGELLDRLASDPLAARRQRLRVAGLALASALASVLFVLLAVELREQWLRREVEQAADRSLAATEARIAEARAAGDSAATARAFEAFVADPRHDGTPALARAWLHEAVRRRDDGDGDAARTAFASAYVRAVAPDEQLAALVGLAQLFRARLEWDALASLFRQLDREHPGAAPELAPLRRDVALGRRDFAAARAELTHGGPASVRALAGALVGASATTYRDVERVYVEAERVVLTSLHDDPQVIHIAARAPGLPPLRALPAPAGTKTLQVAPGEPLFAVGRSRASDDPTTLYRADPDGLVPLLTWEDNIPTAMTAADLDGDGVRELYLGTGAGRELITLTPGADGRWERRVVYSATDTLESIPSGLAPVDLDGDGRLELAASFSSWRAYDVRLLRLDGATQTLRTVARDKLGMVLGITPLRGPGGAPRMVAHNAHADASALVFPPDRPYGDPAGVYIYAQEGDRLVRRDQLAHPLPAGAFRFDSWPPKVGDANGDGRDDIALEFARDGRTHTLLYLQEEDGEFTPVLLGALQVLAFAQLDDDPADELIANVAESGGGTRLWVVGAGDETLAPLPDPPAPPDEPGLDDPAWNRTWRHAKTLQGLGLRDDAASEFADLGPRASRPGSRAAAYYTAAVLRERSGREREALALYSNAAQSPELAADALQGAMRTQLRLGDYEGAQQTLAELQRLPAQGGDVRRALAQRWAPLVAVGRERVDLDFDRPLAPAWTLDQPLGLRHRPGARSLAIATDTEGSLARLPVAWKGEMIELAADLTVHETEWGSGLEIALVPEDDAATGTPTVWLGAHTMGTSRGGVEVARVFMCGLGDRRLSDFQQPPLAPRSTAVSTRLTMRVSVIPALGEVACELTLPDGTSRTLREPLAGELLPAGRHRLVLRTHNEESSWLTGEVHRVTLRGFEAVDEAPADPARASLTSALVRGDPVEALASFEQLGPLAPPEQVWRAHALLQVGRVAEARTLLAALLAAPGPVEPALRTSLRAQPELLGPLLRELDPERYLAANHALWRNTALNHLADPRARDALLAVLGSFDAEPWLRPAQPPDSRARACDLLTWRARAYLRAGEPTHARADLERALSLAADLAPDTPQAAERWLLWLDLASLAAAAGDPAQARDAIDRALAESEMPLLVGDVVRARPELHALARESASE